MKNIGLTYSKVYGMLKTLSLVLLWHWIHFGKVSVFVLVYKMKNSQVRISLKRGKFGLTGSSDKSIKSISRYINSFTNLIWEMPKISKLTPVSGYSKILMTSFSGHIRQMVAFIWDEETLPLKDSYYRIFFTTFMVINKINNLCDFNFIIWK